MRLSLSVGAEHGKTAPEILRLIQGETALPASAMKIVEVRARQSFVDILEPNANAAASQLNRARVGEKRIKVKRVTAPA